MINHPLHPQHLLILSRNSPRKGHCNLCSRSFLGFVYYCPPCNFNLHINCALLQHFLLLCTNIGCSSFKTMMTKSSTIVPAVRNHYPVQFITVPIVLILSFLTFIRNVLNYRSRLITPTTGSILLLSCQGEMLIPSNVVAICAKSDGEGLFILALSATLSFLSMISRRRERSPIQVTTTRGRFYQEGCHLFVISVALPVTPEI
ncbi:hypothetical protein V6N13_050457 [Hibiscus sabdariffa]